MQFFKVPKFDRIQKNWITRIQVLVALFVFVFSLSLSVEENIFEPVYAKSKAKKSTKKKSSTSSSAKRKKSTSSKKRSSRSRSRSKKSSRHRVSKSKPKPKPKPKPPSPEELAAQKHRQETYQALKAASELYDQGVDARIRGDYKLASEKFTSSLDKLIQYRSYQKGSSAGTIVCLSYFELGKTKELSKDWLGARDNYQKCLGVDPGYPPALERLVNLLCRHGQFALAQAKAQEGVRANPKDPVCRLLLSLVLEKRGDLDKSRIELAEFNRLQSLEGQIIPKHNAKQKNVVKVSDYLKGQVAPDSLEKHDDNAAKASGKDETEDDDAISEDSEEDENVDSGIDSEALKKYDERKGAQAH